MVAPARERRTGPGLQVDSSVASRRHGVPPGAVGDSDVVGDGEVGTAVSVGVGVPEDVGGAAVVDGADGVVGVPRVLDDGCCVGRLLGACVGVEAGDGRFGRY
jgi:hypothetical protein